MGPDKTGIDVVEIDLDEVRKVRAQIPSLHNERPYDINVVHQDERARA